MRTSPPPMRPPVRRRATTLLVAAALALAAAACGGDDDPAAAPTTTSPATTTEPGTTAAPTTAGPTTTAGPGATTPVEGSIPPAEGLTPAYVKGVLAELMEQYRALLVRTKGNGTFDETYFRDLAGIYTGLEGRRQTSGLQQVGGVDVIRPDGPAVPLGTPAIVDASPECISFTIDPLDFGALVTVPLEGTKVGSVRLIPAPVGEGGSPWRINYLDRYAGTGLDPDAECP